MTITLTGGNGTFTIPSAALQHTVNVLITENAIVRITQVPADLKIHKYMLEKNGALILEVPIPCSQITGSGLVKLEGACLQDSLAMHRNIFRRNLSVEQIAEQFKIGDIIGLFNWPVQCEHDQDYVAKMLKIAKEENRQDVIDWVRSSGIVKAEVTAMDSEKKEASEKATTRSFTPMASLKLRSNEAMHLSTSAPSGTVRIEGRWNENEISETDVTLQGQNSAPVKLSLRSSL